MRGDQYDKIPKKKLTISGLRNTKVLFKYLKPYRAEYIIGIVFLFISSGASLAFPKLIGNLVGAGDQGNFYAELNRLTLILGVLLFIQATASYFRTKLFINVSEKTLAKLRQDSYRHLIKLPLNYFYKHRVGELNSRISADLTLLQETLTTNFAELIRQIIILFGGVIFLFFISIELTLFMLAFMPAIVLITYFFGKFVRKYSRQVQKEVAQSNTIVEETLQGIQSVKSYTKEFFEIKRYGKRTEEVADFGMKGGTYRAMFSAVLVFGMFGMLVALIWKSASLMQTEGLKTSQFVSFIFYAMFIAGSIGGMASVITRIQSFIGATEDLFEIFESETEDLDEISELKENERVKGNITFENLSFAYASRPDADVIENLTLNIEANKTVAIVGPSGAGKSTITSLLLRLHEPTIGKILFDGKDSKDIPLSVLRNQIALVPQDIFLFGGSIKENIAYGNTSATDEEIVEVAKQANAWEFIERFDEGLETIVGERGTQLSGGQRQRVAIARALLKNPKILILDEATSSLDSESERLVQEALDMLMKGRTSIVIAHRLATIRKVDIIFVLENGRLVESGKHEQLLSKTNGVYRNLSELQEVGR